MRWRRKSAHLLPRVLLRVLPVAALAMVLIGVATSSLVENSFQRQIQESLDKDARFGSGAIAAKLDAILASIRSVAANDLVINALVDTEAREAYVPLYFNQLQVPGLGSKHEISFVDYRGRLIASNGPNWTGDRYAGAGWLKAVIGEGQEYTRIERAGSTFAVPVLHQGFTEGAIIVEIGSDGLDTLFALPLGTRRVAVTNAHGVLYSSKGVSLPQLDADPKQAADWIRSAAPVPGYDGFKVIVAERKDTVLSTVDGLEKSLYLALGFALVALTIGVFAAAYLTTKPLSRFAAELRRFGEASDLDRRIDVFGALEFRDLADSFNSMLARLQNTVVSNEQMSIENKIRRRAEQAVRDREARTRAIVETANDGIVTMDAKGRVESFNSAATELFGYREEEVIGKNVSLLMPEPYRSAHDGYLERYLDSGDGNATGVIGNTREVVGLRKDGSTVPIELSVSAMSIGGERMFTGVIRDIADRKKAETAVQEQNERFNVALENMSHGVCVFDADGRLVVSNRLYATLYKLPPSFVVPGRTAREIAQARTRIGVYAGASPEEYVEERIDWGSDSGADKVKIYELHDGRSIRVSRQLLSNGGWVSTHQDITETKRMERFKNELVSIVSHELRTPLTSLSGSLRLLSHGAAGPVPDEAKSLVEIAARNAERLQLLVNDILDIEKIRSDSMKFDFAPVNLVTLAKQALVENSAYGREHGVELRLADDVGKAYANVDENRLMQVLANLLSNATKFSSPQSEVVLRISRNNGKLRFAVTDSGCGIPGDKQGQLFEKFFQVDASDTRSKRGTGLGLAIVKSIVSKHGSRIRVESEVGKGSTFYFDLEEIDQADAGDGAAEAKATSAA